MILEDNIIIILKKNNQIYQELKAIDKLSPQNIIMEKAKNDKLTLKMRNEISEVYIHSKYNPLTEAETFLRQFENMDSYEHILFIGTGLGYHLQSLLEKHKQVNYSIFEPNIEILYYFLKNVNLKSLGLNRLQSIFTNVEQLKDIYEFSGIMSKKTLIITLPFVDKYYSEEVSSGLSIIRDTLKDKRQFIVTNAAFQKRWIVNSLKNFSKVLETPNMILDIDSSCIKNKPVILVAAGPSLSYEIENLKHVKENGLAYIFSVGSAINSLVENGVFPDGTLAYDPTGEQYKVLEKIKTNNLPIPLIFGSSIGFEALLNYSGPMLHMITSQDTISTNLLGNTKNLGIIQDSLSITHIAFQMLTLLGVSKVIFVGQNFAFLDNKRYADGIKYDFIKNDFTIEEENTFIFVDGVDGERIASSEGFIRMRESLESYISFNSSIKVINTTQQGAKIEGAEFKLLRDVIKEDLGGEKVVNSDWFISANSYDMKFVECKMNELNIAYNNISSEIEIAYIKLAKIKNTLNINKLQKLETLYGDFDQSISKMRNNTFYLTIIEPLIRVQNGVFYDKIKNIKYEKNVRIKAKVIIESFGGILNIIKLNYNFIKPIFEEFKSEMEGKGISTND